MNKNRPITTKIPTINTIDLTQESLADILTEHGQFAYILNQNAYVIAVRNSHTPTVLDYKILEVNPLYGSLVPGGSGDTTKVTLDNTSTSINVILRGNEDITYTLPQTNDVKIILSSWKHGNYSGLTFEKGSNFINIDIDTLFDYGDQELPLIIMRYDMIVDKVYLRENLTNSMVQLAFYCDGLNIYCYYTEIDIYGQGD